MVASKIPNQMIIIRKKAHFLMFICLIQRKTFGRSRNVKWILEIVWPRLVLEGRFLYMVGLEILSMLTLMLFNFR